MEWALQNIYKNQSNPKYNIYRVIKYWWAKEIIKPFRSFHDWNVLEKQSSEIMK